MSSSSSSSSSSSGAAPTLTSSTGAPLDFVHTFSTQAKGGVCTPRVVWTPAMRKHLVDSIRAFLDTNTRPVAVVGADGAGAGDARVKVFRWPDDGQTPLITYDSLASEPQCHGFYLR